MAAFVKFGDKKSFFSYGMVFEKMNAVK